MHDSSGYGVDDWRAHQAYVVDRPWSDGDYVIIGHPDPHEGRLLAVCTEVDTERDLEEGDEWPYTAQDAAREIARRWNDVGNYQDASRVLEATLREREAEIADLQRRLDEANEAYDDWRGRAGKAHDAIWRAYFALPEFREWIEANYGDIAARIEEARRG